MVPTRRRNGAWISEATGIHICTLPIWGNGWRLEGEVVSAPQVDPEGLSATELRACCRERSLYSGSWRC